MIIADTGAMVALVDADDRDHDAVLATYEASAAEWIVPIVTLPEIDYLLATHVGKKAQGAFFEDVAAGAFIVEATRHEDLARAWAIHRKYRTLKLGLVDAVVMAVAERLSARAIATLDVRHFGAVVLRGRPKLFPRDA